MIMRIRHRSHFVTVKTEGAILPPDLLERIHEGDQNIDGLRPRDYHLQAGERLNEAISRSWNRLFAAWRNFQLVRRNVPEKDPGTTATRERFLLPLFQELGYGRLLTAKAIYLDGKSYPVSHIWNNVPIHLLGFRIDLDRRTPGLAGAARSSPHSMIQELLNRTDDHLWAFLSNGKSLRILRDNVSLIRQAYLEFDLEAMFEGEAYADFTLLWLLCHQSRVESSQPEEFWLERWSRLAQEQGIRALDQLRGGVENAITHLGQGFISHKANNELRISLKSGRLNCQDYYRQLLRIIYRFIFLCVAEDRNLLFHPDAERESKERYQRYYSTVRLRRLAARLQGSRHSDLYEGIKLVMHKLGEKGGCPELGLPALGSFLWSKKAIPDLETCQIANRDLLDAIRSLAFTVDSGKRLSVDYKNLGPEELGSVYEALLELQPELNTDAGIFNLRAVGGSERKTTGSYYTPTSLINQLLKTALDPVVEDALGGDDPGASLLNLKVCDPACGSGHFLIAAAHRIAKKLAYVRTGDTEPSPEASRKALRDVISHCIYGVDMNPMAVELCKVNLWLEALDPGKPLSFLDHRIQCGNSLIGATPALIESGIPGDAFHPIEGDDKDFVRRLKKQNTEEHGGQAYLFPGWIAERKVVYQSMASGLRRLDAMQETTLKALQEKEEKYKLLLQSEEYESTKLVADAWCASFFWKKCLEAPLAVTEALFRKIVSSPEEVRREIIDEIKRISDEYRFFHWHLAFPEVFRLPNGERPDNPVTGWSGGFDVVLGNPPWERVKLQEKEWFAGRNDEIARATNKATRGRLIRKLKEEDPALYKAFLNAKREAEAESHFIRNSGRYPLCGRGDINTYAVFAELKRSLIGTKGRVGCIVPTGIATDDTTKTFFQNLTDSGSLVSLYDFENRKGLFPGVHRSYKFCLLTLTGSARPARSADFVFFALDVKDLREENRHFSLSREDILLLNPNTRTCPIFRSKANAELTKAIYRRVPVLIREGPPEENPWGIKFMAMFHMSNDSHLFRTCEQLEAEGWRLEGNVFVYPETPDNKHEAKRYLPLYEAKMIHHFDHRFGDYRDLPPGSKSTQLPDVPVERKQDPNYAPLPRYWVPEEEVEARLEGRWDRGWLLGWRDITNTTNERTVIASLIPRVGVGNNLPITPFNVANIDSSCLLANISAFVFDYASRLKVGGTHLNFFIAFQLPVLPPNYYHRNTPWHIDDKLM
ncbi:MAG: N-6 DNA methylase, partial [Deltaproteobacteria bacterium]|nr:N-6 DNA methylase [Deltaproteobacteria bacterium]